jgi:RNA polymerase sigma factor (sigma-70 family)
MSELHRGHAQAAWDLFAERYRRLILATIRRVVPDYDDVMDVFSCVCEALSANDCARLRRYSDQRGARGPRAAASVATWLVVVVHNLAIDWRRRREGRPRRLAVPKDLSPLQQQIYVAVCGGGCSHVEAYEMIRTRAASSMTFEEFLREVRVTLRVAPCPRDTHARTPSALTRRSAAAAPEAPDPVEVAELTRRIAAALASCPDDVRVAVELFVVERMPADEVALVVGWPNAKAVYNRVYRALASLRTSLVRDGIGQGDL